MAGAARGLEIIGLAWLYGAKARAAAHHVDDDAGQLRAHHVAEPLLLEADAGGGGGGHGPLADGGRAVDHVDGGHFAFRLHEHAARFGHPAAHVFGDLVLGRDGVAEIGPAARADGGLGNRLIAFP